MLTREQRAVLIAKIRQLPLGAEAAVRGLDDRQLNTPYRDGGWTVRQVIHHLADAHCNGFIRLKLALTEDNPPLKPYDQDEWSKLPDTTAHPVADSLAILKGLHARWVALLERLPEPSWERRGFHPEHGEISVEDMLAMYAKHGEDHLEQITGLRAKRGW